MWVIERRYNHHAVGNVEVGVACRQPILVVIDSSWHRQCDDLQRVAILIGCLSQLAHIFSQRIVIRITRVVFRHGQHNPGSDKAGELVDVPVGVVARNAAAEPDHVLHAQIVSKYLFHRWLAHARVAILVE